MKRNIFINCINKNWLLWFIENKKEFYLELNALLTKKLWVEIWTIYFFSEKVNIRNKEVLTEYENIRFIVSKSFNYVIKHFSTNNIFTKDSIVLTSNIWDYYLVPLWVAVYWLKYKNLKEDLSLVTEKDIRNKILDLDLSQYTDYLVLQDKNDDSIWQWKTVTLLKKYKTIENLLIEIETCEDSRLQWIIKYQSSKLNYYLYLKNFFVTSEDLKSLN